MYIGTMAIPYTKVTSIHYESLKKKTVSKIDVNNLSVRSLQGYFLTNVMTLATKMKNFIIQASIKF